MSKKSATVFTIFVVSIIAFCLANVFASMVGTYSFNISNDNNTTTNITNNTIDINTTHNYNYKHVSEDVYDSGKNHNYNNNGSSSSGNSSDDTYEVRSSYN